MNTTATTTRPAISKFELGYVIQGLRDCGVIGAEWADKQRRALDETPASDFSGLAMVFANTLLCLVGTGTDAKVKKLVDDAGALAHATIHGSDARHSGISKILKEFNDSL